MNSPARPAAVPETLAWIGAYVVALFLGDAASERVGVPNAVSAVLLVVLSVVLLVVLRRRGLLAVSGLRGIAPDGTRRALYFLPLALIAVLQYLKGWDRSLDLTDVALVVALMIGVGFLEEALFRGLLFRAILERRGLWPAVLISGATFAIGHLGNLARGYSPAEQLSQVVLAAAVGIVLAQVVAVTGSILPGVVFHILFNISGSVTPQDTGGTVETVIVVAVLALCAGYSYLLARAMRRGHVAVQAVASAPAVTP